MKEGLSMTREKPRYLLLGLTVAIVYWLFDSSVHYLAFHDDGFELIPGEVNELWMRSLVVVLVVAFGLYTEFSFRRLRRLSAEKAILEMDLEDTLKIILGGDLAICADCRKVCLSRQRRHDRSAWRPIEEHIAELTVLKYGHGRCPDCKSDK
jgi:hypothetical protein